MPANDIAYKKQRLPRLKTFPAVRYFKTMPGEIFLLRAAFPFLFAILLFASFFASPAAFSFSPENFVRDARAQIGKTLYYDPGYARISYPMGDVPIIKGVCTDVVIRALRHQGIDLQQRVHEDLRKNFPLYPSASRWGMKKPDTNIDHRRVPNLQRYFERQGYAVADKPFDKKFLPGDIVTWNLRPGVEHIGIVSDRAAPAGERPLIIHNIGLGAQEEDILYRFTITGHYRVRQTERGVPPSPAAPANRSRTP